MIAEPLAEPVDEGRHGVDREPGRREVRHRGPAVGVGWGDHPEVHQRQLPDAERMVGHDVLGGRGHEPGVHLP